MRPICEINGQVQHSFFKRSVSSNLFHVVFEFKINFKLRREYWYKYRKDDELEYSVQDLKVETYKRLLRYQKEGVEFAIKHYGRILLGDEMGVGKTLQGICIAYIYKSDWPLIIMWPSALKLVWRDEILKWISDANKDDIHILNASKDKFIQGKNVS